VQVQSLLKSLALTFADEFIAQAETLAEKLGSSLGVMSGARNRGPNLFSLPRNLIS
jgi:hypothetical protein